MRLFLLISHFYFFSSATVFALCPPQRPLAIIQYSVSPTEYIKTNNSDHLTNMHTGGFGPGQVLGLAGGDVGTSFKAIFDLKQVKKGLYCLNVKKIKANFFAHPKVYIASNFKRGTCEYSNVLKHEEKHVKTLKKTHREYMPKFKQHLKESARALPVLEPMNLQEANDKKEVFVKKISEDLSSYMQIITMEVAQRQKEVDSKEEYQRVMDRCSKWDERLAENP